MKAKVNGTELFFDVEGSALIPSEGRMVERPVCFALHGGPGVDSSPLRPWLSPLAKVMQLVYVDYRNTGRSARMPLETCTVENMIDDLEALRLHLGLDRIAVLGHSFGGILAMPYAVKYPCSVSHLILGSTSPYWGEEGEAEKWDNLRRLASARPDLAPLIAEYTQGYAERGLGATDEEAKAKFQKTVGLWFHSFDPQKIAEIGHDIVNRTIFSTELSNWMMKYEMPKYDMRPRLHEITARTLILAGRWDYRTTVEHAQIMQQGIPGAELVIFEESSHMLYIEEQDKFVATVTDFMERHPIVGS
jgi:proline iminopeptidase